MLKHFDDAWYVRVYNSEYQAYLLEREAQANALLFQNEPSGMYDHSAFGSRFIGDPAAGVGSLFREPDAGPSTNYEPQNDPFMGQPEEDLYLDDEAFEIYPTVCQPRDVMPFEQPHSVPGGYLLPEIPELSSLENSTSTLLEQPQPVAENTAPMTSNRRQRELKPKPIVETEVTRGKQPQAKATSSMAPTVQPAIQNNSPTTRREMEAQILLEGRAKGLKYSEIMKTHDFGIVETSLRGRIRTLTKPLSERARVKTWFLEDVSYLHTSSKKQSS